MDVRYLQDVPIPERGEWLSKSTFDPLHPEHGPLPNLLGLLEYDGVKYTVAVKIGRAHV